MNKANEEDKVAETIENLWACLKAIDKNMIETNPDSPEAKLLKKIEGEIRSNQVAVFVSSKGRLPGITTTHNDLIASADPNDVLAYQKDMLKAMILNHNASKNHHTDPNHFHFVRNSKPETSLALAEYILHNNEDREEPKACVDEDTQHSPHKWGRKDKLPPSSLVTKMVGRIK